MKHQRFTLLALAGMMGLPAIAADAPSIWLPGGDGKTLVTKMSDNGEWIVSVVKGAEEGDTHTAGGVLINVKTREEVKITHPMGWAGVSDVTDDGNIVVGEVLGNPGYYVLSLGEWTTLPVPEGYSGGTMTSVTPDGKLAVGYAQKSTYEFTPVLWDLESGEILETPNAYDTDRTGNYQNANKFSAISPDGRYIIGENSWFYGGEGLNFVYDRETQTNDLIGFEDTETGLVPKADQLYMTEWPAFSANGKWITGFAYIVGDLSEYNATYRYNVETKEFELYNDGTEDMDVAGYAILDDGTVLAATPAVNPYRYARIRYNNYWYDLDQIYKQVYGIDLEARTGYPNSGAPTEVSGDGRILTFITSTSDNYVLFMNEHITEACARVDLLGDWNVTPADGSVFGSITNVTFSFSRNIGIRGTARNVQLVDEEGNQIASASNVNVEGMRLTVTFRSTDLEPGKRYEVVLPTGFVCIAGDTNVRSQEIRVAYTGRREGPVGVTEIYPEPETFLKELSMSLNPILLTFDSQVKLADSATVGGLYRVGEEEPFCTMGIYVANNQMLVYPVSNQYLRKDTDYRVVVPAGVVTDLSGKGANEEIEIIYHGTYVPDLDPDYLYRNFSDDYRSIILYDGDHRQPFGAPADWGFTADLPWFIVRSDDTSNDMAYASHSMYNPAGQSDDWMMTTEIEIPDRNAVLTFDAQSYLNDSNDRIKVYVYVSDNVITSLNKDLVETIRNEADLIIDRQLMPGASEEGLAGDWEEIAYSLEAYAGKQIYIAFVNDNNDQSAIFIDNIAVKRTQEFGVFVNAPEHVVQQASVPVSAEIVSDLDLEVLETIEATLLNSAGEAVDTYTATGLAIAKGDTYSFTFAKELPLTANVENTYSVAVTMYNAEGESFFSSASSSVKNLAFSPVRRVVLEEFTGKDCANCPLGIRAIENLHAIYGDRFIPIAVKGYNGTDPLGAGVMEYAQFLGLNAAPSARIDRAPESTSPMVSVNGDYRFSGRGLFDSNGIEQLVWLDIVGDKMNELAEADIISPVAFYKDGTNELTISAQVRWALNAGNQNISVFAVLTEDNLEGMQMNNLYNVEDPDLGEWGKGGEYAKPVVYPYYNDHVARGTYGRTFNGTSGLIPATLAAGQLYDVTMTGIVVPDVVEYENYDNCHVVIMLIDNNTGRVINSVSTPLQSESGVGETGGETEHISVAAIGGGNIAVEASAAAQVEVFDIAGNLVARAAVAEGRNVISADTRGVAIVRVVSERSAVTRKVVIR